MSYSIHSQLRAARKESGDSPALLGSGRRVLSHADLVSHIDRNVKILNDLGLGRGDRIALVLPNGPETTVCSISVACTATSAPLNPAATASEIEATFRRLGPTAVIVSDSTRSQAANVAEARGIPVLRLIPDADGPAGSFRLMGKTGRTPKPGLAEPDDVAFLVHTSGSTSKPKLAPLTHRNVCHGAMGNVTQLGLTERDRCLCVTALFYTQGILVSVLSSLVAGGSVVCTPGYDPVEFFHWLDDFRPTWFAAPVSVQQSILAHAAEHSGTIERSRLRVIRCSSAVASPEFVQKVEKLFRAPMLDAYGLTETSSTVVGEPLPPGIRKRGSIGKAVGCEIAVMDSAGKPLKRGEVGELVVRGPGVIRAYEADPETNRASFHGEWLRTGDLGRIDADGYVFLTGRIKEIINRGGEKISPVEIDDVLNAHPDIAEALAFSIPDPALGEEIGAAVVLRNGARARLASELREFAALRLAPSKVPRRFVFVDEIPKAATGKYVRIGLAEKLGVHEVGTAVSNGAQRRPKNTMLDSPTMLLLHIWEDVLGKAPIGVDDDFFDLGGDSLLGARLIARVEETFGKHLSLASLFEAPTVARMALLVAGTPGRGYDFGGSKVITIRQTGSLPPLFLLDPHPVFRHLILSLPKDAPVYGVTFPDPATLAVPFSLQDIAERQADAIQRFHPKRPYALLGWCAAGILAYEVARILESRGEDVSLVTIIDAFNPARWRDGGRWGARSNRVLYHLRNIYGMDWKRSAAYIRDRLTTISRKARRRLWRAAYRLQLVTERRVSDRFRVPEQILSYASNSYLPGPYAGRVLLLRAERRPAGTYGDPALGWRKPVSDLRVGDVPGNHIEMFSARNVPVMAGLIVDQLRSIEAPQETVALRS